MVSALSGSAQGFPIVGLGVGEKEGLVVGSAVGWSVGEGMGEREGWDVDAAEEGDMVGPSEGRGDGRGVGSNASVAEGDGDGDTEGEKLQSPHVKLQSVVVWQVLNSTYREQCSTDFESLAMAQLELGFIVGLTEGLKVQPEQVHWHWS
jgi:hypothetical protein